MRHRTPFPVVAEESFAFWAESNGWAVTKRGWPDLLCYRDHQFMVVEVKAGRDGLRPDQVEALRALHRCGVPTYVWTPESGLRPYPAEPLPSTAGLEQRIADLQAQLAAVTNERDALLGEVRPKQRSYRPLGESPPPLAPKHPPDMTGWHPKRVERYRRLQEKRARDIAVGDPLLLVLYGERAD